MRKLAVLLRFVILIKSLILEVVDQGWVCHSRANIPYINISLDRLQQLKFERYSKQKKGKKNVTLPALHYSITHLVQLYFLFCNSLLFNISLLGQQSSSKQTHGKQRG